MDLADIYRPMLCVAPAAKLFTKRMLDVGDFSGLGYSAALTSGGGRKALRCYSEACRREVKRRDDRAPRDYLTQMRRDAGRLAHCMLHPEDEWQPLEVR